MQPFEYNCRLCLNISSSLALPKVRRGGNINTMTHSFLALKGFQIVSKFKPLSAGQRVACGQLDDQSFNTHNSFPCHLGVGMWALQASSSRVVNLAPVTSIWFIIKIFNSSKMNWQDVQRGNKRHRGDGKCCFQRGLLFGSESNKYFWKGSQTQWFSSSPISVASSWSNSAAMLITHWLFCFSGGASGKESACQCRKYKRCGFDP